MKYWFFDGSDVTGPFTLKELAQNKSFSETSLVCPENFSDDGDHWQMATTFADLKPLLTRSSQPEDTATFDEEMDTLLKERSPLSFEEVPTDGPGLEIPKKPAKPGPIEDYFDRIKEEDLGDILGIPNPNENSDMDLAHALEKQLAKTSSTRRREREQENELDEQTAAELKKAAETHHVATATEVFATQTPILVAAQAPQQSVSPAATAVLEKELTMPLVESPTMPTLASDAAAKATPEPLSQPVIAKTPQPAEPEELVAQTPPAVQEEPKVSQPETGNIIPDPAQLRREKVEVNSIRARLKQTQEMKDFLHETQSARLKQEAHSQRKIIVMLLAVLAIVGGLFLAFQLRPRAAIQTAAPQPTLSATARELLNEPTGTVISPASVPAPAAAVNAQTGAKEQKALEIVQNYPLSGQRGALSAYLNRIYQAQLAQGYTGTWAAEPLYKNTYIVKYRLTKTRKEPIIYVFQADVAQGKLTGALNNISLDLVGKL